MTRLADTAPDAWRTRIGDALLKDGPGSSDFDLNPDVIPKARTLRDAAVLVPLIVREDQVRLILTKRASTMRHHPGQIAFPGGKMDPTDATLEDCALREAHEEIGLPRDTVSLLGRLPSHETVTSFIMTPILGWIDSAFDTKPEPGEVAEVFSVPLTHVLNPSNYAVQSRIWQGRDRAYYTVPYGPYYIWGATARILRGLAERMSERSA